MINTYLQRTSFLYGFAIFISIVFSLWINSHETVINPDAICYLYSAKEVSRSGLHAAMQLCPQAKWPFYSILIFTVAKITHLSYTISAFLLNGLFSALSVVMFIAIVKELGGSYRVLWLAAIVILVFHEFNILRQDIIRDHGYWLFYLASLFFLLRFFQHSTWLNALGWSASLMIATLFRIEGVVFLLLLPLLSGRFRSFLMLNLLLFITVAGLLGWLYLHPEQTMNQLGRVSEVNHQFHHGFAAMLDTFQRAKLIIGQHVLNANSLRDAGLVVGLLYPLWYLINVIGNLSWIYAALVVYAWATKAASFTRNALKVVIGYLAVNLIVTFGFFAENQFLSKRYLIAFSLTLMLWVPFALDKLLQSKEAKQKILKWLAILFIFISAIGGFFHFGHNKEYIREAGDWLAHNIPKNAKLYVNDYQLMYYSHHFGSTIFQKWREYNDVTQIAHERWKQYDYLALLMGRDVDDKTAWIMQEIHLAPLQVFANGSGKFIYIYKISHREKRS